MIEYTLVTGNDNKWREAERILLSHANAKAFALTRSNVDLPELQAATTKDVALEKARVAFEQLRRPVIVEDTGFELTAFGGFPGPFIKFWEKLGSLESICRAVDGPKDRGAFAVCVLGICTKEDGAFVIEGRVAGTIAEHPRGDNGFGWDVIFVPENETRTFAEMTSAEKDRISHRRRAWESLANRAQL